MKSNYKKLGDYIHQVNIKNVNGNIDFDTKMTTLQSKFVELLKEEEKSKQELLTVFKELGYEIKL